MIFYHPTKSSTGIAVSHHRISRVELSQDLLDVLIWLDSWPDEADRLAGHPAAARWHVRTPASTLTPGANLLEAAGDAVLATDDFAGASVIADNALALDTLKARKWAEIVAERSRRERGTFTVGRLVYDLDAERISSAALDALLAKQALQQWSIKWVLADNSVAVLDADQMIAVGRAAQKAIADLWATSQTLREQIDAAESDEALSKIEWP